jgi:VWFA-related protein
VTRLEELVVGRWRLGAAALVAAALTATIGAAPQQPQRAAGTVHSNVRAVLVDVVVHDKKGEPVRDLTESDFQITEDGVPQKIASFTPVMEGTPRPRTAPSAPTLPSTATVGSAAPVEAGPIVTALLFDRLGPESRRLAVQAAQDYVGSKSQASSYVGIFGIDMSLASYVPFTRDIRLLKAGLDKMAQRGTATSNSQDAIEKATALEQAADAAAAASAPARAMRCSRRCRPT